MKLFSRKALVAGAAAVALSFAGTSVAAAEEGITNPTPGVNDEDLNTQDNEGGDDNAPGEGGDDNAPGEGGDDNEGGDNGQNNNGNGGSSSNKGDDGKDKNKGSSDMKPESISAWISVFTAVIGALGALFAFASKHLGFKL